MSSEAEFEVAAVVGTWSIHMVTATHHVETAVRVIDRMKVKTGRNEYSPQDVAARDVSSRQIASHGGTKTQSSFRALPRAGKDRSYEGGHSRLLVALKLALGL